jgi:hypothetical protein
MRKTKSDIFKDRRALSSNSLDNRVCRRKGDFGEKTSDSEDWWLKVNYISQHLTSVKKPPPP